MIGALLVWLAFGAVAAPETEEARAERVARQQVVASLAARVAQARADGAPRSEVAALLAQYRAEAEALAALTAPVVAATEDAEQQARLAALASLRDAVAKGSRDERARQVLGTWLGEPSERVALLDAALADARTVADPVLRNALLLDAADQAAAVALVATYDAASALADAERAMSQAAAERARSGPGSLGALGTLIEAERLEREAASARARRETLLDVAATANTLVRFASAPQETP